MSRKIQISLMNAGVLNNYHCRYMIVSRLIILVMKNVSEEVAEKYKTHSLCSITFFPRKSCRL